MTAEAIEVWPDNWDVVGLFTALGTQWRTGFSGATGLDYSVIPTVLKLRGMKRSTWPDLFEDLRVLETEALNTMKENQA